MLVEARTLAYGSLIVRPVNEIIRERWAADTLQWGGRTDGELFLQGDAADEFIDNDVPRRKRRDLRAGWTVRFRMDGWTLRHMIGYCVD